MSPSLALIRMLLPHFFTSSFDSQLRNERRKHRGIKLPGSHLAVPFWRQINIKIIIAKYFFPLLYISRANHAKPRQSLLPHFPLSIPLHLQLVLVRHIPHARNEPAQRGAGHDVRRHLNAVKRSIWREITRRVVDEMTHGQGVARRVRAGLHGVPLGRKP